MGQLLEKEMATHSSILFFFFFFFYFTTLYWFCHTSTCIHHGCTRVPILKPPPTALPIPSLWVIPVHQPQASCILHWTWTDDSFLIWYYTCFNAILPNHPPPIPSPTEPKRLFYTSVSLSHSSILSWNIPWTEEPGRLQSMWSQRVGHDWVTSLSLFHLSLKVFTSVF